LLRSQAVFFQEHCSSIIAGRSEHRMRRDEIGDEYCHLSGGFRARSNSRLNPVKLSRRGFFHEFQDAIVDVFWRDFNAR